MKSVFTHLKAKRHLFCLLCHVVGSEREGKPCKLSSKVNRWRSPPSCVSGLNIRFSDSHDLSMTPLGSKLLLPKNERAVQKIAIRYTWRSHAIPLSFTVRS